MREVVIVMLVAAGCHKDDPPAPPPPPPAPSASVSVAPASSSVAPAAPEPSAAPSALPGMPPIELACAKDTDCGPAFWSDTCCNQCAPRIGTKAWAKKMDAFCTKPENKNPTCKPVPCGFAFGVPRCSDGKCVAK